MGSDSGNEMILHSALESAVEDTHAGQKSGRTSRESSSLEHTPSKSQSTHMPVWGLYAAKAGSACKTKTCAPLTALFTGSPVLSLSQHEQ